MSSRAILPRVNRNCHHDPPSSPPAPTGRLCFVRRSDIKGRRAHCTGSLSPLRLSSDSVYIVAESPLILTSSWFAPRSSWYLVRPGRRHDRDRGRHRGTNGSPCHRRRGPPPRSRTPGASPACPRGLPCVASRPARAWTHGRAAQRLSASPARRSRPDQGIGGIRPAAQVRAPDVREDLAPRGQPRVAIRVD